MLGSEIKGHPVINYLYSRIAGTISLEGENQNFLVEFVTLCFLLCSKSEELKSLHTRIFSIPGFFNGNFNSRRNKVLKLLGIAVERYYIVRRRVLMDVVNSTNDVFNSFADNKSSNYAFEVTQQKDWVYKYCDTNNQDDHDTAELMFNFLKEVNANFSS